MERVAQFLADVAEARDLTDLNIAAGSALEKFDRTRQSRSKKLLRKTAATVASVVAFTVVGDTFAASPVHAGIAPWHPHVFTSLGAHDWTDHGRANVFGHALPW